MHLLVGRLSEDSTFDLFEILSKFCFPKLKLPNSGCGLSANAAYAPVLTVSVCKQQHVRVFMCRECRLRRLLQNHEKLPKVGKPKSSGPSDF